jgi:RNA recognition motif-containing protein
MAPAGEIERAEIAADVSGRSRGYGTVRYATKEGADAAVATLNGAEFEARALTVKLDRFG